ncbi:hypothetical protein [Micromonospora sp. NPDC126480]|uniref:hypothetical protein n=1 Tax=Micromonospora sp. NPDC126480 TaxID=3155312 RepID=UPI0033332647
MRRTTAALIGAVLLAVATGCGTGTGGQGTPAPPGASQPAADGTPVPNGPNVAEALDVANKQFKLLADGEWAGAYALWTDAARKEVAQKDFEKVNRACPYLEGEQIQLQDVKAVNMELVELTWRHGDHVGHSALRHDGKTWRYDPGGETLVEYASGADAAIAKRKADNLCPAT